MVAVSEKRFDRAQFATFVRCWALAAEMAHKETNASDARRTRGCIVMSVGRRGIRRQGYGMTQRVARAGPAGRLERDPRKADPSLRSRLTQRRAFLGSLFLR
jgi:hypothetical protein